MGAVHWNTAPARSHFIVNEFRIRELFSDQDTKSVNVKL